MSAGLLGIFLFFSNIPVDCLETSSSPSWRCRPRWSNMTAPMLQEPASAHRAVRTIITAPDVAQGAGFPLRRTRSPFSRSGIAVCAVRLSSLLVGGACVRSTVCHICTYCYPSSCRHRGNGAQSARDPTNEIDSTLPASQLCRSPWFWNVKNLIITLGISTHPVYLTASSVYPGPACIFEHFDAFWRTARTSLSYDVSSWREPIDDSGDALLPRASGIGYFYSFKQ